MQRFPITAEQIDQVVARFYQKARVHPVLGPVFMDAVGEDPEVWRAHEAKISAFWRNAIQLERGAYSGNPMMTHLKTPSVQPEHFAHWLDLFHATLHEVLPKDSANSFGALADRIGKGLSSGLETMRQPKDQPPKLI